MSIAQEEGTARRLHPLTLALAVPKLGPQMVNFIPAIVAIGATGRLRYLIPAFALFVAISLLFSWLAWMRFRWTLDGDAVTIDSGIFSRKQRVIPLDRIQDVSIEQGVMHRLLGLAVVGFETGSSGGDKKDEARLNAIAASEAAALREHIRQYRAGHAAVTAGEGAEAAVAAAAPAAEDVLFRMGPGRLVIAGLFNFSLAVIGLLFGAANFLGDVLPIDPFDVDMWRDLAISFGLTDWVDAHRWLTIVGGTVMILLVGALAGVARTVLRDWGFTLRRTERGYRRTRGLTTRTDMLIPRARIQAAIISTGPVRRLFGWHALYLQSLASDGKDESDHLVLPFARLSEIDVVLADAGLSRSAVTGDWHRPHIAMILPVPAMLLVVASVQALVLPHVQADVMLPVVSLTFASALFMALLGFGDWTQRRWRFDGRTLESVRGWMRRRHVILPARNVQSADIALGPLRRGFGLVNLMLGVPGGKATRHSIAFAPEPAMRALRADMLAAR